LIVVGVIVGGTRVMGTVVAVVGGTVAVWFGVAVGSVVTGAFVVAVTTGVAGTVVACGVVFIVSGPVHPAITITPMQITRRRKITHVCISP
jgi:hypothetical protein